MVGAPTQRPLRIGGASGGFTDRVAAIRRLASDPDVDAIVGDWMSENTMAPVGVAKELRRQKESTPLTLDERMKGAQYANTFLQCFEPAIHDLMKNKTKLVVNAGGSDTELLAEVCLNLVQQKGYNVKVAWVEGDEVTEAFKNMVSGGHEFVSLTNGQTYQQWGCDAVCAQAYIGSLGICEALNQGADIVICGR